MALNQVGLERLNTATTKKIGTNKNLIINGAMEVAQRGTSSSSTNGIGTVDRFHNIRAGHDEEPTQAQHALTSADTGPYAEGFRFSFHVTNGNQSSGAGAGDYMSMRYNLEAQNLANSGWNYTSSSSFITLSFWIKSSVAQNFYGYIRTVDGTAQNYPIETGSLTADTWTKITKTIPGNSNLTFDNDSNVGLQFYLSQYWGTNYTDNASTVNNWVAYSASARMPDNTSTWWTTNDATFEITGVQLEVGNVATDFEHRSFAEELNLCHRYYYLAHEMNGLGGEKPINLGVGENSSTITSILRFPITMRTVPTMEASSGSNFFMFREDDGSHSFNTLTLRYATRMAAEFTQSGSVSLTSAVGGMLRGANDDSTLAFTAEL